MKQAVHMEECDWGILKDILTKYNISFYAFGSRVKGTCGKFSDLDLMYKEKLSSTDFVNLKEELETSDLLFAVDLVYLEDCTEDFKKKIEKECVKLTFT